MQYLKILIGIKSILQAQQMNAKSLRNSEIKRKKADRKLIKRHSAFSLTDQ
jgi:hypothetical protein